MSNYAVEVKNVKKSFFLPHNKNNSLKSAITQAFKPKEKGGETFNALNGVSFNVEKGDFFGILGRNGSGKSTLLKIIAEIYQPTSGSVKTNGRVVSFIELGVGFRGELSGRENVFLNGALLGFSKEEIEEMYDEIVEFAELEEFMDQKLKNYSSGMKVRLAFSVAIQAKADILILDEVLAVGDAAFQKKCYDYFRTLRDDGKTVILVTHGMGAVRDFCNKAIVIDGGKVIFEGNSNGAADKYLSLFNKDKAPSNSNDDIKNKSADITATNSVMDENINISLKITPLKQLEDPIVAILINKKGSPVFRWVSDERLSSDFYLKLGLTTNLNLNIENIFPVGVYSVDVMVRSRDRNKDYSTHKGLSSFKISNTSSREHDVLWRIKNTCEFKVEQSS